MLFILHQVNCQNAFGAGFAGYLTRINPAIKQSYHEFCRANRNCNLLGQFSTYELDGYAIVHIFGQQFYGNSRKTGKCYTDYESVEFALANFRQNHPNDTAICPQYMGCGLAGGNWNRYSTILAKYNIIPCDRIDLEHRIYHKASNPSISLKDIIDTELCYIDYNAHVNLVRYGTPVSNNVQLKCRAYQYALNKLNLTIEDLDRYFVGYEYPLNEAEQAYDTWRRDAINFLVNKFLKTSK